MISFFKDGTYSVGLDYSGHKEHKVTVKIPDEDLTNKTLKLIGNETEGYSVEITPIKQEETEEQKKARVWKKLLELSILDEHTPFTILEGVQFSDTEKGDLIAERIYKDAETGKANPHSQFADLSKAVLMLLRKQENPELITDLMERASKVDKILRFFKMAEL